MDSHLRGIAVALGTFLAFGFPAQSFAGADGVTDQATNTNHSDQVVHCESAGSGRTHCGTAHSRYAMNGTPPNGCVRGSTWGFDDLGVWVSGDCKADFDVVAGNDIAEHRSKANSPGGTVHCAPAVNGHTYCGGPHMQYTMSGRAKPECVKGSSWDSDDRGVWVSGGCIADFDTTTGDSTTRITQVRDFGRLLQCVSAGSGRTYCGAAHAHYVISDNTNPACVEGSTWGVDDRGAWVAGSCVAVFRSEKE